MKKKIIAVIMISAEFVLPSMANDTLQPIVLRVERAIANAAIQTPDTGDIPPQLQSQEADKQLAALAEKYPQYQIQIEQVRSVHKEIVKHVSSDIPKIDEYDWENKEADIAPKLLKLAELFYNRWLPEQNIADAAETQEQNQEQEMIKQECIQILNHLYKDRWSGIFRGVLYSGLRHFAKADRKNCPCHDPEIRIFYDSFYELFSEEVIQIK